ncbi:MAG: hypothetical protein ED557_02765 [Balneola sp.]|nr:MAG: hypothetical protein ED557_02765 [Balneola sp.]
MNIGIVTSFAIGGILMISILAFNGRVLSQSAENTVSVSTQIKLNEIIELVNNDFNRIGFGTGTSDPFVKIEADDIIFEADAFDGDSYGVTNIRWEFDKAAQVTTTKNPNDFYLKRTGPITGSTYGETRFPVAHFSVVYKTANDAVTTNTATVKKISVEIIIESPEPYSKSSDGTDLYQRTVWKRTFVPNNINLPY